ncbi:expansin B [Aphelenchoides avenae]|nr:expansin B [Aphelenchus avenae]
MVHLLQVAIFVAASAVFARAAEFTYYNDVGYGACGTQIDASGQLLAAVSHTQWTSANPNADPLCQKCVQVSYNGKTITVPIKDKCPGCAADHVDLSLPAFQQLENPDVGRAKGATFAVVDCAGGSPPAPVPAPQAIAAGRCGPTESGIGEAKFRALNPSVNCDNLWVGSQLCTA